ncbi:MAG: hypothetical protein ACYCSF_11280 [Acidimicrobiales bacterium]
MTRPATRSGTAAGDDLDVGDDTSEVPGPVAADLEEAAFTGVLVTAVEPGTDPL